MLFAFALIISSGMDDAHYHVLMVVPIITAAFRFNVRGLLACVSLAVLLTVGGVIITKDVDDADGLRELFEACTDVLVFIVVGTVVWTMAEHLRRDAAAMRSYFEQLQTMQTRVATEERLAAVGRLASAIAHEIRNPVAAIASSLAVAEDSSTSPAIRQEMSRIAAKEAGRLEALTSDFLTYARVRPLQMRSIIASDIVQYVTSLMTARAAESAVTILALCPAKVEVNIDDFQVQGALVNLLMNAIEAGPANTTVTLGLNFLEDGDDAKALEFYVQSPGSQIPADVVSHIFEPFFTTRPTGTGLGLAIARNTAVAHGGSLELSHNISGDIQFSLFLPRSCVAHQAMCAVKPNAGAPPYQAAVSDRVRLEQL